MSGETLLFIYAKNSIIFYGKSTFIFTSAA